MRKGKFVPEFIASCGMNCGVCLHYLRERNKCPGCFSGRKVNHRPIKCGIKLCKDRRGEYCFNCDKFPCERLKRLDKRYRTKYNMSMIENLKFIKKNRINKFLGKEKKKWKCSRCGGMICCHNGICSRCGLENL
jgi:hypothetical protein